MVGLWNRDELLLDARTRRPLVARFSRVMEHGDTVSEHFDIPFQFFVTLKPRYAQKAKNSVIASCGTLLFY